MSLLFETIKVLDGVPFHLPFHNRRMNRSRQEIWHANDFIDLVPLIKIPVDFQAGLVRCNVYYERSIENITFKKYEKKVIRSLKLVYCDDIDYHVKYTNRSVLEDLLKQKENCDDILIVKNNLITDSSSTNIIFFNGQEQLTPETPLLWGVTRERLLEEGKLKTAVIAVNDLPVFRGFKLINAMRDPDEEPMLPIGSILP